MVDLNFNATSEVLKHSAPGKRDGFGFLVPFQSIEEVLILNSERNYSETSVHLCPTLAVPSRFPNGQVVQLVLFSLFGRVSQGWRHRCRFYEMIQIGGFQTTLPKPSLERERVLCEDNGAFRLHVVVVFVRVSRLRSSDFAVSGPSLEGVLLQARQ